MSNRPFWIFGFSLVLGMQNLALWVYGQSKIILTDVSDQIDAKFEHFNGKTGVPYIVETVTSGIATFDYDGDGMMDVYILNGAPLLDAPADPSKTNHLFRNVGEFQFVDVTSASGTGDLGFALGVAAGDFDNDGDQDLFVSNFGPNILLENNGDGTFARHEFPNSKNKARIGAGVSLLDIDRDGNLDVFFANYVDFTFEKDGSRMIFGRLEAPGPKNYDPDTNTLLSNKGDGTFVDISVESGIASVAGPGMGVVSFDYDMDGDVDVFVCNDSAANFLFQNEGGGRFSEVGLITGVAYDVKGNQQATMGVDLGDFNGDGLLDLVTTNFSDEIPTLYLNSGMGFFDDVGPGIGLGIASNFVKWGVAFVDWDNDGWQDLMVATGHVLESGAKINDRESFASRNYFFRNLQGKRFAEISAEIGNAAKSVKVSRALAVEDFDNDGDMDAVVLNQNDSLQWIRNDSHSKNNWIDLKLVGIESNRDAVSAKVVVKCDGRKLVQEVLSGRGYQSHFGSRLHFGLGAVNEVEVEIQWPSNQSQKLPRMEAGHRWIVWEDKNQIYRLP